MSATLQMAAFVSSRSSQDRDSARETLTPRSPRAATMRRSGIGNDWATQAVETGLSKLTVIQYKSCMYSSYSASKVWSDNIQALQLRRAYLALMYEQSVVTSAVAAHLAGSKCNGTTEHGRNARHLQLHVFLLIEHTLFCTFTCVIVELCRRCNCALGC